jgi:hypothetical protein
VGPNSNTNTNTNANTNNTITKTNTDASTNADAKLANQVVPGRRIAFSSYPGNLFSTDDWYTTSAGLAVTETTIDNHNTTLWQHVLPTSVLTWLRTMVANRLAKTGPDWAAAFALHNSGTYNNEFHVVDYNAFAASKQLHQHQQQQHQGGNGSKQQQQQQQQHGNGQHDETDETKQHQQVLLPHVLTIVDQMPGFVETADATSWLEQNGWVLGLFFFEARCDARGGRHTTGQG